MFEPAAPGVRKVIVATNIAESSVTINDISYVIDFGLEKVQQVLTNARQKWSAGSTVKAAATLMCPMFLAGVLVLVPVLVLMLRLPLRQLPFFDARNNTEALLLKRCSQASAKQRAGRAGRVMPGVCFRLYSKVAHDKAMPRFAPPEMLRTSLLTLVLKVKIMDKGDGDRNVGSLLLECIQPPPIDSVRGAFSVAHDLLQSDSPTHSVVSCNVLLAANAGRARD